MFNFSDKTVLVYFELSYMAFMIGSFEVNVAFAGDCKTTVGSRQEERFLPLNQNFPSANTTTTRGVRSCTLSRSGSHWLNSNGNRKKNPLKMRTTRKKGRNTLVLSWVGLSS